jgi:hypothetical protein
MSPDRGCPSKRVKPTGHLVWGVYNGAVDEVTSPSVYNLGAWTMVVAEIGSGGMKLYVNNSLVVSNAAYTTPQNYTGYWHIGWVPRRADGQTRRRAVTSTALCPRRP